RTPEIAERASLQVVDDRIRIALRIVRARTLDDDARKLRRRTLALSGLPGDGAHRQHPAPEQYQHPPEARYGQQQVTQGRDDGPMLLERFLIHRASLCLI